MMVMDIFMRIHNNNFYMNIIIYIKLLGIKIDIKTMFKLIRRKLVVDKYNYTPNYDQPVT